MSKQMDVLEDIRYVGVSDREITLFEGLYPVEKGMSYNSYLIMGEKTAVLDSVEEAFVGEWLCNIEQLLQKRDLNYLVIQHMEPDHSAGIVRIMQKYPKLIIVSSQKSFILIKQLFGEDFHSRRIVVDEGDVLSLGSHKLTFIAAPMVHWPEVFMTYEHTSKTLFSADAFGKFNAWDVDEDWETQARRYYFGIVGKFGKQVQNLLRKLAAFSIQNICPLHGYVLRDNLSPYIGLYDTWSKYVPEKKGVLLAYTSVYGNTERATAELERLLLQKGQVVLRRNLLKEDLSVIVAEAFCYDTLVLATTTYNGGIFPIMEDFLRRLTERNFQNRKVALIENGSWLPVAARKMRETLERTINAANTRGLRFADNVVTLHSTLGQESSAQLQALAKELST